MSTNTYPEALRTTIKALSNENSYKSVCHHHYPDQPMPSMQVMEEIVDLVREIIFPGYFGGSPARPASIEYYIGVNVELLYEKLRQQIFAGLCFGCDDADRFEIAAGKKQATEMAIQFISQLPDIRYLMSTDVEAAYLGDPAAKSRAEVIFCYPAIRAVTNYRIAHALLELGVPLIPRAISEMAHSETGIDIHPRAKIGHSFTIDHGTGVVIGATSIIGNHVKIYQGVTLGAKSFPLDEKGNPIKGIPRHPIVEDNVVIYSQATILGRITIGANSVIGGNVWITSNVPPNSKVIQEKWRSTGFVGGDGI
ncbi:serine O-acetyltransferase EpsC [Alkalitalea saponilacus]|uniref:serine O-acetyltransferase n=1 Tax=Alkalitalea saponilacus TaxID=889453 RepID=A0A1T5HA30_9BACT|nr:serine O-acetyltransferase EpsC [Alkalitalea saponilacus]ASB50807.1 serine acetyltransferase [Alkalitalea saponilacus]SKC17537.1 serine O-acetyltransferase [Alkalitalea saponilacus]